MERLLSPPLPSLRGAAGAALDALRHPEADRVPLLRTEALGTVGPQLPLPVQAVGAASPGLATAGQALMTASGSWNGGYGQPILARVASISARPNGAP